MKIMKICLCALLVLPITALQAPAPAPVLSAAALPVPAPAPVLFAAAPPVPAPAAALPVPAPAPAPAGPLQTQSQRIQQSQQFKLTPPGLAPLGLAPVSLAPSGIDVDLAPPGISAPIKQEPKLAALKGSGGGLAILDNHDKEQTFLYRPWSTRFELHPYDLNDPNLMKAENRIGYRHFYAANPNLGGPNSRDREVQSTVELVFGLTALASIICGVLIIYEMSVLDTEHLNFAQYQDLMMRVVIFAALPWLALGMWLLTVFGAGVINPMRDPKMVYNWQCSAMAWFLPVAAAVNTAYFTVHALWLSRLFFTLEMQVAAPMGRMFNMSSQIEKMASGERLNHTLSVITSGSFRYLLLFLEAVCAIFGYMLITFRWGANSQFCHPEVYWATTALVVTVSIIIVFTFLALLSTLLIASSSSSPWMQDFVRSFWDARMLAKVRKHEAEENRANALARKAAKEANYEAEFNAWSADYDQDMEEQRQRQRLRAIPQTDVGQMQQPEYHKEFAPVGCGGQDSGSTFAPSSNFTMFARPTAATIPLSENITSFGGYANSFDQPPSLSGYSTSLKPSAMMPQPSAEAMWKDGSVKQQSNISGRQLWKNPSAERILRAAAEDANGVPLDLCLAPVGGTLSGGTQWSANTAAWSSQGFLKPFGQR